MKTVNYYYITIPFSGEPKEEMKEYKILASNKHNRLVINDSNFTTLDLKKDRIHNSHSVINDVSVWKSKYGWKDDGWRAQVYFQCSQKVMRRKVLNRLKKEMQKEMFFDATVFEKLANIINKK